MRSDGAAWVVLVAISLALGFHPLVDLDLGWHLAGGIAMFEQGAVLWDDPLSSGVSEWINYSWLPDLLFVAVYRLGGFEWLRLLQWILALLSIAALFVAVRGRLQSSTLQAESASLTALLTVVLTLPFLAPFWQLRPQLLSVVLFTAVLSLLEQRRLGFRLALLLSVFWSACHVYWILVPSLWLLYRTPTRRALLRAVSEASILFAAGMLSPYGVANLKPVAEYAFSHRVGYLLIDEFQPLRGAPFEAVCFGLAVLGVLWSWGNRTDERRLKLLLLLLGLAAVLQRKYLPLFGVVWALLIAVRIGRVLVTRQLVSVSLPRRERFASGASCVFLLAVLFTLPRTPPLAPRFLELLELMHDPMVERALQAAPNPTTFNHFDDGGWLAFASASGSKELRFRTTIDGRTLVAGPIRLAEFYQLVSGDDLDRCAIFKRWGGTIGVAPRQSNSFDRLFRRDEVGNPVLPCLVERRWEVLRRGRYYDIWGISG